MTQSVQDNGTGMRISREVLESVCKRMIRMILFCLPDAFRGTIYSVGPIPYLQTIRIASGRRNGQTDEIIWGVANPSDYDYPGKGWEDYRDRPGGILEAMAWCVERQKSWTAEDPENNIRCVRKQLEGKASEDYHHMEPVLVSKADLWDAIPPADLFPENDLGKQMWNDSLFATVAVIKIHFLAGTIKQGDRATKLIKELSRSLGTEMLSLHARELAVEKEKRLVEERGETCNILAHEFRNLLTKIGAAYRVANNEVGYLRELWEDLISKQLTEDGGKKGILLQLNDTLEHIAKDCATGSVNAAIFKLAQHQKQLAKRCLLPHQNEMWLRQRIEPLWSLILSEASVDEPMSKQVERLLVKLKESFYVVLDFNVVEKIQGVDEEIKRKWVQLAYLEINSKNNGNIQQYIELLDTLPLEIPHKRQSMSNFIYLKRLIEIIPEIEKKLNHRLDHLKNSK
jgi:hypothetical protein